MNHYKSTFSIFLLISFILAAANLFADDIYEVGEDGKETLEVRDAIITKTDAGGSPTECMYLTGGIVNTRTLNFYRSSKSGKKEKVQYRVVKSSSEEKEKLIDNWKRTGYTVEVTGNDGLKTQVYNFALDFALPPGMAFATFAGSSEKTSITLKEGQSKINIDFADIKLIKMQGKKLTIILTEGKELAGDLQPLLTTENKALKPYFRGIRHYANKSIIKYSIDFDKVKSVAFHEK